MIGWDVWLNNKLFDTVWFDDDMSMMDVKKSLIDHDGYDSRIIVQRRGSIYWTR